VCAPQPASRKLSSKDIRKSRFVNFLSSRPYSQIPSVPCASALRTATDILRMRRSWSSGFGAGLVSHCHAFSFRVRG
jgi:hypothetical protein